MKPHPALLQRALRALDADRHTAVFVGDSENDLEASRRADVRCIAFANKAEKAQTLSSAGATTLTFSMAELAGAMPPDFLSASNARARQESSRF